MKIIHLKEDDSGIKEALEKLEPDYAVYSYEAGYYEGHGFAVWKKGDQWFYDDLGHCSCYGPTENLSKAAGMPFTFEQVREVSENNYYTDLTKEIIKYIEDNNLR